VGGREQAVRGAEARRIKHDPRNSVRSGVECPRRLRQIPTTEILMTIPLYRFDNTLEGRIPVRLALKMEVDGTAQLVRQGRGVNGGKIRRAVLRRRPGDPHVTTLRDHIGQAYSYIRKRPPLRNTF
jgi:hypothetical protein